MKQGQSNVAIWAVISLCSFLMSKRHQSQWLSNTKCPPDTPQVDDWLLPLIKRSFSTAQPLGLVLKDPPLQAIAILYPPNLCSQPSKLAIDPPPVPGTPSCRNGKFYIAKRTRISGFPGYPRGFSRFLAKKWKIDVFSMKSQWLSNTNSVLEVLGVRNTGLGGGTPPLGGGTPPLGGSGVSFSDIFPVLRLFGI